MMDPRSHRLFVSVSKPLEERRLCQYGISVFSSHLHLLDAVSSYVVPVCVAFLIMLPPRNAAAAVAVDDGGVASVDAADVDGDQDHAVAVADDDADGVDAAAAVDADAAAAAGGGVGQTAAAAEGVDAFNFYRSLA